MITKKITPNWMCRYLDGVQWGTEGVGLRKPINYIESPKGLTPTRSFAISRIN